MKKNYFILAGCCLLLTMTGCKKKVVSSTTNSTDSTATETVVSPSSENTTAAVIDSFKVESVVIEQEGDSEFPVNFKFTIDFPQKGSKNLVNNVRKGIFVALGDSARQTDFTLEELNNIGKRYVAKATHNMKEILKEYKTREDIEYANNGKIVLEEETDRYVTYLVDSYLYEGGAHGMPQKYYLSFDKLSGNPMQWKNIFSENQKETLSTLVREAIVQQYYKGKHEWDEIFKFSLPQQAPAFTSEGLTFYYRSYEIDAYAAGMPNCTLPYAIVKPLMTPEAQALIPEK